MATARETISSLYIATFDRAPDLGGLNFWLAQANSAIAAGTAVRDVYQTIMDGQNNSDGFSSHPVFINNYGALSNAAFVEQIYQNVLGQAGDPDGIAFWENQLNTLTRGEMIVDFVTGALDFNPADFSNLTTAQLQTAVERQALLENKVAVALHFVDTLGATSNITTTPPELDQAYLASIAVLKNVNHEAATVTTAKTLIDTANATTNPIDALLNPAEPDPDGVSFTVKTTNTDFQTNDGANDADEGNNTSAGVDTINATAAQVSDAATIIDGLELADTLNITNTTGANSADLSDTATKIENIETVSIAAGVSQLKLLSADIAGNTEGEIATLTGNAIATQKVEIVGDVNLTGLSNSHIEEIRISDTATDTELSVTIDTANLSGVTQLALDNANAGGNDSLILSGSGTFDFSNIALNVASTGANTLSITGDAAATLTVDDTDLDNIGTLKGNTTAEVITTLNFTGIGTKGDLSGMTVTDIDTVSIAGEASTLTLEESGLSETQFITITGTGDSKLVFAEGGPSQEIDLTNTTISGFTQIDVDSLNNFDTVILDAESIAADAVTLHGGADSKIQFTETDNVTGLAVNSGDFKGLILDAGVDITADSGLLNTGSGTFISGAGATSNLTINMSTTSLNLASYTVGSDADDAEGDINIVINDTAGNDTITAASTKETGSTMSINLANGGNDIVRLENFSGNLLDGMVIADAVSITGFDVANDQINIETAVANGTGIASVASNAVDANTAISIINNAFIAYFSSITQLSNTVGTYTNGAANDKFVIAVSNNNSQTAIYSIVEEGTEASSIDAADTVTLLGIVTQTGTFDTTNINLY